MSFILVKGILISLPILSLTESRHFPNKAFPYPPPIPPLHLAGTPVGPSAGAGGPLTGPGAISGPGPITGPGPIGPTGSFGPSAFGPGPVGPFPAPPGPFGFGPFGHFPFFPPHPHGPCHFLQILRKNLPNLLHPILIGGIALFTFLIIKNVILPYIGLFALKMGRALDEADQTAIDRLTDSIRHAISRGACLERLACQIGRRSTNYHISPSFINVIGSKLNYGGSLIEIFKKAASSDVTSCDHYACWDNNASAINSPYKYKNTTSFNND